MAADDSISTKCCKDSTIIFQTSNCSIIQYPTWLQVQLVTSPYGNVASSSNTKGYINELITVIINYDYVQLNH